MTNEEKTIDQQQRAIAFKGAIEAIQKEHQFTIRARIMPEGPIIDLVDGKVYEVQSL